MSWLQIKNLHYHTKHNFTLTNISLEILKNEKVAVIGSTGSGKSTLLKLIAGLLQPTSGSIYFQSKKIKGPNEKLLPGHNTIAYLSQHFELRNNYVVKDLLEVYNKLTQEDAQKIYEVCDIEHLLNRKTNELSGGEKQRIAFAISLIQGAELFLLDEPYSNLDLEHKNATKKIIDNIINSLKVACILIAHEPSDYLNWATRILVLQEGKIIQDNTPINIYNNPANVYVANLTGYFNLLSIEEAKKIFTYLPELDEAPYIIIRPEKIKIQPATNIFQKDCITQIQYFGSYYIIEVNVNNVFIVVKVLHHHFKVGDRVIVSITPKDLSYLKN
jgi:iron(III) transport system ATP-binding protein